MNIQKPANRSRSGWSVQSGQDCPCSGVWTALEVPAEPLTAARGEVMPGVRGRVVTWVLFDAHPENLE